MELIKEIRREDLKKINLDKIYFKLCKVSNWYKSTYKKEEMTKEDFLEIQKEDFSCVRDIGYATIDKFLWLQRYLKGEVRGVYKKNKQELIESEKILKLKEQLEKHKKIENSLRVKITNLEVENANLKRDNKRLTKIENKINELKKII